MNNFNLKCVITHDTKNTTVKTLLEIIDYLKQYEDIHKLALGEVYPFKEDIFTGKNTIVRIINSEFDKEEFVKIKEALLTKSIDCTTNNVEEKLVTHGAIVFSLDSNEVPLVELFNILPECINSGISIAVPMIHMKYKDEVLKMKDQEFKFKKFIDQPNIFYETESDIEIRLREIPNSTMPKIPLSSKWVDWPKTKTVFKTKDRRTQVVGNMNLAVYKFEKILEK